jgi:hypothetical protein
MVEPTDSGCPCIAAFDTGRLDWLARVNIGAFPESSRH